MMYYHRRPGHRRHIDAPRAALLGCLLLPTAMALPAATDPMPALDNILLLSSWAEHLPWSRAFHQGIQQALISRGNPPTNLYTEYLDHSRLGEPISHGELAALLRRKYHKVDLDGVIVDAAPAIAFVLGHGLETFGEIPAVLLPATRIAANPLPNRAVIAPGPTVRETISLALRQNPDTRLVVLIGDHSPEPRALLHESRQMLAALAPGLAVRVISEFTITELEQQVRSLPEHALIIFTLVFQDRLGRAWRPVDVVERLAAVAPVPIYVFYDSMIGVGVVGGHVQSARQVGETAVQAIADLIERRRHHEHIHREYRVARTILDWRALQTWDIPRSAIPPDAEIRFREPRVWEVYFRETLVAILLIVVEGASLAFIAVLYIQRRRLNRDLLALNTDLEQRIDERTRALHRMATLDDLTGLPNRKAFHASAHAEFQRFRRYGNVFTLALLDIDHFKAVNDTHGHPAGDRVLQVFARAIREKLRAQDMPGRVGGEEFAILLPETGLAAALSALEKLRRHVATTPIVLPDGRTIAIAVSIGATTTRAADQQIEALFQRADQQLYRAKRGGRNRVVLDRPLASANTRYVESESRTS